MAEVSNLMESLLREFQVPDVERLRRGEINELSKLLADRGLILKTTAAEIECDESCHAEAVYTLNELRKMALEATPCIRGVMREIASGKVTPKHDEMLECCTSYYARIRDIIATATVEFAPDLYDYYETKFN